MFGTSLPLYTVVHVSRRGLLTIKKKMLLPRVAGHALQEEQPGLLVEDGVGGAACVARHKLLQNRDPDLFFTITNSTTVHSIFLRDVGFI